MRSLGFGSKVVAVCFFAAAVILTLGLPWYGLAPVEPVSERTIGELHGPLDGLFDAVVRWFGEHDHGVSAWTALGRTDKVIALFAILAAVSAVLANLANVEHAARAMLRGSVLVVLALVALNLFDTPGPNAKYEPRFGIFAACTAAIMLAVSGFGLAEQQLRASKRRKPRLYEPVSAPAPWQDAHAEHPTPPSVP
jgi:hypothetical protein